MEYKTGPAFTSRAYFAFSMMLLPHQHESNKKGKFYEKFTIIQFRYISFFPHCWYWKGIESILKRNEWLSVKTVISTQNETHDILENFSNLSYKFVKTDNFIRYVMIFAFWQNHGCCRKLFKYSRWGQFKLIFVIKNL